MDTEIDLDPREQKRRRAAEKLEAQLEIFEDAAFDALENARDAGLWIGKLEDQRTDAKKMANAMMRIFLGGADIPPDTLPWYFKLKEPT